MKQIVAVAALFAAGAATGAWLAMPQGEPSDAAAGPRPLAASVVEAAPPAAEVFDPTPPMPSSPPADSVWTEQLNAERQAREELARDVAALRRELQELAARLNASASAQTSAAFAAAHGTDDVPPRDLSQRLQDAGFTQARAQEITARFDKINMDRLFLRDRAVREDWLGSERYADELGRLDEREASIREQFSDDEYDRFLYASGQFNRVVVNGVMAGSPAELSGLQALDVVVSYDGQRIFSWNDLREATTNGSPGQQVLVEVERGGERLQLYVPRGPLGVRLDAASIPPA